ncbi:MAG: 1-acyl-sn-glycerol-3-phosphate acyltransferase [Pirellulales bacterium]
MQQIIVEKPYQFVPPIHGNFWPSFIQRFKLTDRHLAKCDGVVSYELRDLDRLKESLRCGAGVILAPNHARNADPLAMGWLAREAGTHVYAMASWHLFNQSRFQAFAIRAMGGFSVFREGMDRQSLDLSIQLLSEAKRPLILFPEGAVFRTNDILQPLLDGVSFLARTAAKRREKRDGGKVVIHPVAIKYLFRGDLHKTLAPVLDELEERLTWIPNRRGDLLERIRRLALAMLSIKEVEAFGSTQTGAVVERQQALVNQLLKSLELKWLGSVQSGRLIPRLKALRSKIVPQLTSESLSNQERNLLRNELADIYLAQQISSYPPGYLDRPTTVTRILETVERLEEDITGSTRVHGNLHAVIQVGDAIEVPTGRTPRDEEDPIMTELHHRLQSMLDLLAVEAGVFE